MQNLGEEIKYFILKDIRENHKTMGKSSKFEDTNDESELFIDGISVYDNSMVRNWCCNCYESYRTFDNFNIQGHKVLFKLKGEIKELDKNRKLGFRKIDQREPRGKHQSYITKSKNPILYDGINEFVKKEYDQIDGLIKDNNAKLGKISIHSPENKPRSNKLTTQINWDHNYDYYSKTSIEYFSNEYTISDIDLIFNYLSENFDIMESDMEKINIYNIRRFGNIKMDIKLYDEFTRKNSDLIDYKEKKNKSEIIVEIPESKQEIFEDTVSSKVSDIISVPNDCRRYVNDFVIDVKNNEEYIDIIFKNLYLDKNLESSNLL